jgi:MYXO-CTERM domain-containing protein
MKKTSLLIGLLAFSASSQAALLHLDTTYVEYYRILEPNDDYDVNKPFQFQFDVYGSLTLTEEDEFATPVLTLSGDLQENGYMDAFFKAAPRASDNQPHADFVGAYTRTGKLGTITLNLPYPYYAGTGQLLTITTGVGRKKRDQNWLPSEKDQTASMVLKMIPPQSSPPPVPEPASLAVLGVGALALLRRRRNA